MAGWRPEPCAILAAMRWGWLWVLVGLSLASPAWAQQEAAPPEDQRMLPVADPPDELDDTSERTEDDERGIDLVLPVFRLAFGTAQQVDPASIGGFAFDLVLGSRLAFQPMGEKESGDESQWRPVLSGELGYSRRAGGYGTHDLTLGLGFGFYKLAFGAHLYETIVFGVDGSGRIGSRTTLRLDTLWGLFHLDLGYEIAFADAGTTHDIRGVIGVDVGLLISVFVLTGKLH